MNGRPEKNNVEDFDVFNFQAISCLEQIGISKPSQVQIDTVEGFLKRAGQRGKGCSRFTRTYMRMVINNSYLKNNKPKGRL